MKPCEYYIELLSAGLDGQLTAEQEQELARHLVDCPACRELGPQLVAAHAAFAQMGELEAPEGFAQGVMDRVRAQESARPKVVPFFRRPQVKAMGALAACAMLCVGLYRAGFPETMNVSQDAADQAAGSAPAVAAEAAPSERAGMELCTADNDTAQDMEVNTDSAAPAASGAATDYAVSQTLAANTKRGEEPERYGFANPQALRVSWGSTPEAPSARVLGSAQSLAAFLEQFSDDLTAVADAYGEEYFQTGRLLAAVVEANSGSIRYEIAALYRDSVRILRHEPEEGTCDMAAWLLLAEVDTMFDDGDVLSVDLG